MEINTNIIIGLLFVVILVLLFSKVSVSMENNNTSNDISKYNRPNIIRQQNSNPSPVSSRNVTYNETLGLPAKDNYMSNGLKQQLNNMENKFYYNNCRWEPNF